MKRNIVLVLLVLGFNIVWLYGVSYTNRFIAANELMVIIGAKEPVEEIPEDIPIEEIVEYEGESFEKIGNKIEKFLTKTKLEGYGEYIAKYSVSKSVNPYLIGAMIIVNSNCSIQCNAIVEKCNNVGDLTGSSGGCFGGTYRKYNNLEDGIKDLVDYTLDNFYANDLKTPSAIYRKYNKNSAWSYKVSRYMERIKKHNYKNISCG